MSAACEITRFCQWRLSRRLSAAANLKEMTMNRCKHQSRSTGFEQFGRSTIAAPLEALESRTLLTLLLPPSLPPLMVFPASEPAGSSFELVARIPGTHTAGIAVGFYRETNGVAGLQTTGANPDLQLGLDNQGADGFNQTVYTTQCLTGKSKYYARVFYSDGKIGSTAAAINTITSPQPPLIQLQPVSRPSIGLSRPATLPPHNFSASRIETVDQGDPSSHLSEIG
jgi:hypothetical protein